MEELECFFFSVWLFRPINHAFYLFYIVFTYYAVTFLCLDVSSNPAVLNNTVVVTVPYRYCSQGDSEKCSTDLLLFPGSEDSKRWQPSGSSGFSLSTADVDKFRNPHFFQRTDLIRRGPSVCNQSRARISSLRVVDNGPQNAVTATQRRGLERVL